MAARYVRLFGRRDFNETMRARDALQINGHHVAGAAAGRARRDRVLEHTAGELGRCPRRLWIWGTSVLSLSGCVMLILPVSSKDRRSRLAPFPAQPISRIIHSAVCISTPRCAKKRA